MDDIYFSKKKSGSKSPTGEIPPLPAEMFDRYKDIYSDSGNPSAKAQRGRHTGQPGRGGSTNQQKSVSQRNAGTNASRAQHHNESRSGASPANTRNSSALNAQRNAVKSKKKRKHKLTPFGRFVKTIFTFCLIFAILSGIIYSFAYLVVISSGYSHTELQKNQYISASSLYQDKKIKNILLIGVDDDNSQTFRSDTMMLLSIDSRHKNIKLSSFLRDTWVEIPGQGNAKLNASCSYGGAQLVVDTIEYNFNPCIDSYILVNFNIFVDIIDKLGGIKVDVTQNEAEFINRTSRQSIAFGENVELNGEEALVYCRIRKLDSDFMRTFRQRKVMNAVFSKLKRTNPFKLVGIARDILSEIETSMSPAEVTGTACTGVLKLLFYDTYSLQVPAKGTWEFDNIGGQSVINCEIGTNIQILHDFIYENDLSYSDEKDKS